MGTVPVAEPKVGVGEKKLVGGMQNYTADFFNVAF